MENTNWINWEENTSTEKQPTQSWGDEPQTEKQPTQSWGDEPQTEKQPTQSWGDLNSQPTQEPNTPPTSIFSNSLENVVKSYSYLGGIDLLKVKNELYYLDFNSSQILEEFNSLELKPLGSDGLFQTQFNPQNELGNIVTSINHLAQSKGLKLTSILVKKLKPSESSLNILKGTPKNNFILFLQGDHNSGEVILDLSTIGGPTQKVMDTTPNHLSLLPGWLPYRITKNNSDKELIALIGTFS